MPSRAFALGLGACLLALVTVVGLVLVPMSTAVAAVTPTAPAVSPSPATVQETLKVTGSLAPASPAVVRSVILQRLQGVTWTAVASANTDSRSAYSFAVVAPSTPGTVSFRVVAPRAVVKISGKTQDLPVLTSASRAVPVIARTPPADVTPPATPASLVATAGNSSVALSWGAVSDRDVAGYHVYRATAAAGPWVRVTTGTTVATSFVANGLVNGLLQYFAVTAIDASGNESARGPAVSATPRNDAARHCGTLAQDEVWRPGPVHVVDCPVIVPSGITLTVEPGAVVKARPATSLQVRGTLDVNGVPTSPVVFASWRDDSVGGDSNADGAVTVPAAADWDGIVVGATGAADLQGVELRHAVTALAVEDGAAAVVRGRITDSLVGVRARTFVDATGVDWGSPSGPAPVGTGTPAVGGGVHVVPWTGFQEPAVPLPSAPGLLPSQGAEPAASSCRPLMFIGVRGSGQRPVNAADDSAYWSWLEGFGPEVSRIAAGIEAYLDEVGYPREQRRGVALRYTALDASMGVSALGSAAFMASVWQGVDRVAQYLDDEIARCGTSQRYVLAGFSQGALVLHLYLTQRASTAALGQIAAVGLLADPAKNSGQAEQLFTETLVPSAPGSAMSTAAGLYRRAGLRGSGPLPAAVTDRTVTVCNTGDIVCAPGVGALWDGSHSHYTDGDELLLMGRWLAVTALQ